MHNEKCAESNALPNQSTKLVPSQGAQFLQSFLGIHLAIFQP